MFSALPLSYPSHSRRAARADADSSSPYRSSAPSSSSSAAAPSALPRPANLGRRLLLASSASILLRSIHPVAAEEILDESLEDEDRTVTIFQETSPSVVFIKDFKILKNSISLGDQKLDEEEDDPDVQVEGVGSGFLWDKFGHIVTNYHVIEKLATDQTGLRRCKIFIQDSSGNSFAREGKLIGIDPAHDLAVLKVNVGENRVRPVNVGSSRDLRVGQRCFAIGNPFGYEHTLTTGVVSGLGREIPSPDGRPIKGAIQTDASINSGNSGGPLIDSHGHVIGVNTATFTRRGTGTSSGVNFAVPIDLVVKIVPYLIINGTIGDRY